MLFFLSIVTLTVLGVLGASGVLNFSKSVRLGSLTVSTEVSKTRFTPFSIYKNGL